MTVSRTSHLPIVCLWKYEWDITSTHCVPVAGSMSITLPTVCLWKCEWDITPTHYVPVAGNISINTHCVPVDVGVGHHIYPLYYITHCVLVEV